MEPVEKTFCFPFGLPVQAPHSEVNILTQSGSSLASLKEPFKSIFLSFKSVNDFCVHRLLQTADNTVLNIKQVLLKDTDCVHVHYLCADTVTAVQHLT